MATVDIKIFKHHKKVDGTYNVKIRVTHKRDKKYFDTPHFVSERQLTPKLTIKDAFVRKLLNTLLDDYRATISELGEKLELFTAESLRDYLKTKNQVIDFIKFSNDHIEGLIKDDRSCSAKTLQTVVFSLSDYFKRKSVSPIEINEQMLTRYERFLRNSREITRLNQFKKPISRRVKGMTDAGVRNHLRDCRSVIAIPLQIGEGIALLPAFLIGQMAAKKLVSLIVSNRAPTEFETMVLPTQLFARESSLNLSKVK